MKFSESWLREWSNPAVDSEKLSEQLTMAGLEVDDVALVAGKFTGVVVGKIVECHQHLDADKLRVTKVDIGANAPLNIVCGAPNCRVGLVVACATIGAELPGDFKIKSTKLRGELSEGMLCSYSELGISDDHNGIIELPQDAPIGQDLRQYLNLDDHIIEISVTPNRADCFGIAGIARDISAVNNIVMTEVVVDKVIPTIDDVISIKVEAPEANPRYLGRVVKGINFNVQTPNWMQEKLRRCGIRSIDPVVDVTNYVLLEFGHPMHAFDLDKIKGGILVRYSQPDEELVLLDGNKVKLKDQTLVIADTEKSLAIAGVFGGKESGVSSMTQNVLLEAAFFTPISIAGKAREYGLHTDASHRYERGVDPALQYRAMERATELLVSICGGEVGPIIDVTHEAFLPKQAHITLRRSKLDALIGHVIPAAQVTDILTRLGCDVSTVGDEWHIVAPTWRFDLTIEQDLIEEIVRIYGYNNVPNARMKIEVSIAACPETALSLFRAKDILVDRGYQEAITYSFVDPKVQTLLHPSQDVIVLPNPISAEMSVMRLSLWSGLLNAVLYNQNRQQSRIRLFESGLRFIPDTTVEFGIRQEHVLSGVVTGNLYDEHWSFQKKAVDFFDLKGDLELILSLSNQLDQIEFKPAKHPALHPGQSAEIYLKNEIIGYIGVVHPLIEKKLALTSKTIVFEIVWDKFSMRTIPLYQEISRYPANRRDIAIIVKDTVPVADILATCKASAGKQLVDVNLFDVYQGQGIAEGDKSLALSLIIQDKQKTLSDNEVTAIVDQCVEQLKAVYQAVLRE